MTDNKRVTNKQILDKIDALKGEINNNNNKLFKKYSKYLQLLKF